MFARHQLGFIKHALSVPPQGQVYGRRGGPKIDLGAQKSLLERLVTHFLSTCVQLAILSDPRLIFERFSQILGSKSDDFMFWGCIFMSRVAAVFIEGISWKSSKTHRKT